MNDLEKLTFGQLAMWRDYEMVPPAYGAEANLSCSVPVGEAPRSRISEALREICARHPTMRTLFDVTSSATPGQQEHPQSSADSISESRTLLDEVPVEQAESFQLRPGVDYGWQAAITRDAAGSRHLTFVCNHMVADGFGMEIVRSELQSLLEDPRPAMDAVDGSLTPIEIARLQTSAPWGKRRDRAQEYWESILGGPCAGTLVSRRALLSPRSRVRLTCPMEDAMMDNVHRVAEKVRTLPQAILFGLSMIGVSRFMGSRSFAVSLVSSNRYATDVKRTVTCMSQRIPVEVHIDEDDTFEVYAKRLAPALLRAYGVGPYDTDDVTTLGRDSGGRTEPDIEFNFWTTQPSPSSGDSTPATDLWRPSEPYLGTGSQVRLAFWGARPVISLRAATSLLDPDHLVSYVRELAAGLELLAREPSCRVTHLMRGVEKRRSES